MTRRYSAISNYAIGKQFRILFVFVMSGILTWVFLPLTGIIHTQDEQIISSLLVAFILASVAKRHT